MQVWADTFVEKKAMKKFILILIWCLGPMIMVTGQEQQAEKLLSKAIYEEEVNGELDDAIKTYQLIVNQYPDNRKVAAKAYFHMGMCYEKLGKQEAKKAYRQVIQKYADQDDLVTEARARLVALEQPVAPEVAKGIEVKQVWACTEKHILGSPSPDGRYLSYTEGSTGNLAIYETATGKKRQLTKQGSWDEPLKYAEASIWSPDSKQIAYDWYNEEGFIELHIIGLDGSKPRILFRNEEVVWAETYDWSPDGRQILACFERKDGTRQIVLVSVEDGSVRVLKTLVGKKWPAWPFNMSFSPNGYYFVYDFPPEEYSPDFDIFLMSTNGGHEISLVEHPTNDKVLGWAPDGKNILFASNRTGIFNTFVIQVADGKPLGTPKLIMKGIGGKMNPKGFTQKGSFYYSILQGGSDVYIAKLDPETGKILTSPKKVIKHFEGSNYTPYYSPNGKYLAYLSIRNRQGIIGIHNFETGEDREFSLSKYNITRARGFRWSQDCSSILAMGRDNKVRFGIFRINVQTGNVTPVIPRENWKSTFIHSGEWSRDGKTFFYVHFNTTDNWAYNNLSQIMVRDLETGTEKELYQFNNYVNISLSPDGKWLASSHPGSLMLMPVTGGETKELYIFEEEYRNERPITWSADGKYILFEKKKSGQDGWDLCRIPAEGGEPQKLGLELKDGFMNLSIHPNGSNIAFSSREQPNAEFWVMENFLPLIKAEK